MKEPGRSARVRRNRIKGWLYTLSGSRPCRLCNGITVPAGASWMHTLLRCQRCGLVSVAELPPAAQLHAAYCRVHMSDYQVAHKEDWGPWMRHKHTTLDALGLDAPGPGPALDLGCGEGALLQVLEERGWEAWGVEINPHLAAQANAAGLKVVKGPVEQSLACSPLPRSFSLVLMNHLIEHLRSPLAVLQRVRSWLQPGGALVVETPLQPDLLNIDHLHCFSPAALELALHRAGFQPRRWYDYLDANYGHHNLACLAQVQSP